MKTMYVAVVALASALVVSSCGGSDPVPDLSEQAMLGREIAQRVGCTACHGGEGQGSVGPAWQGLAGTQVELDDGTTVVADRAYLERAILEPQAEITKGYNILMPRVDLTPDEVAAVATYIQELR